MRIESLLNPTPKEGVNDYKGTGPMHPPPSSKPNSKLKLAKDAPIFRKAPTKGIVRFPPYEAGDDRALAEEHRKFRIYPMGHIGEFTNHIPYSSDKKDFQLKTGRDAFEVFQYQFRKPDDALKKDHTVMWDYNVGLVRITPFFKSCNYSKTTPARMLNVNPGLKQNTFSITGGALAAQGYWMPYAAAKAVTATFAYPIRHALTPIFGPDFPAQCLHPNDRAFGTFKIPQSIVRGLEPEMARWRAAAATIAAESRATPTAAGAAADAAVVVVSAASREQSATPQLQAYPSPRPGESATSGQGNYSYAGSFPPTPKSASWSMTQQRRSLRAKASVRKLVTPETDSSYGRWGTDTEERDASVRSPEVSPKTPVLRLFSSPPHHHHHHQHQQQVAFRSEQRSKAAPWTAVNRGGLPSYTMPWIATYGATARDDMGVLASPPTFHHQAPGAKRLGLALTIPRSVQADEATTTKTTTTLVGPSPSNHPSNASNVTGKRPLSSHDGDGTADDEGTDAGEKTAKRRRKTERMVTELRAAHLLMQLSFAGGDGAEEDAEGVEMRPDMTLPVKQGRRASR